MVQESELIRLILGLAAVVVMILSRSGLRRLRDYRLFAAAYYLLFAGWIFTVIEHLLFPVFFNALEHVSYAVSSMLFLLFCLKLKRRSA